MIKYLISICIVCAICCQSKDKHLKNDIKNNHEPIVYKTIQLNSKVNKNLRFYYIKGLSGHPLYIPSDSTIKIFSSDPILLIKPDNNQVVYYVRPGDNVIINKENDDIVFQISDSIRTNEANFFAALSESTGSVRYLGTNSYLSKKINMRERDSIIEEKKINRIQYFTNYIKNKIVSDEFKKFVKESITFIAIHEKLSLYYPGYNTKQISTYYKDSIEKYLSIFNENDNLKNLFYIDALIQLSRVFLKEESKIPHVFFFKFVGQGIIYNL